ncbi:Zn-ribbon domain-containing OB-fold protein [Blastococcus mobilis]|uniref:DNA-binding protein n=1 Tax=Blastococcus mobilis TaxID=1938746 RepID=A0A238X425_9ACTN|nr:OB-fold domain-containing protein [Blastococcus mobilis]SNR53687.1 hypothetical protein SAMN06272737_111121 [Blastococcus mobilis]
MTTSTTSTPFREGLFREGPDGPALLAGRCTRCGRVSFPAPDMCLDCRGRELETVELGGEAELLCATTVHMPNRHFPPGHAVGFVVLPGGVRIFTQLRPVEDKPFRSGMPMELEIAPLWREDDADVLAYRFVPA